MWWNILSELHHEIVSNPVGVSCARPKVELSPIGIQIDKEINKISSIYDDVTIDKYIIMPEGAPRFILGHLRIMASTK